MRAKLSLIILSLTLVLGSVSGLQFTSTPEYTISMDDGNTARTVASGTTKDQSLTFEMYSLPIGTYNFTLIAGTLTDSVIVTVSSEGSTSGTVETTPFPAISVFLLLGILGILRRRK